MYKGIKIASENALQKANIARNNWEDLISRAFLRDASSAQS